MSYRVLLVVLLAASSAQADIINVPGDQPTIQAGIDVAVDGDEVVVGDGVYTGPGNREIQTRTKLITVRSAGGPILCVIDCEVSGRAFVISGGVRVEGFTMRNGLSNQGGAVFIGGDATIVGCIFKSNSAGLGGAIYVVGSSPTIIGCEFSENDVAGDGGAIYNLGGNPALFNCLLRGNEATDFGGAIFSDLAGLNLTNCTVSDNVAYNGGGIANYAGVELTLSNTILWKNRATSGDLSSAQLWSTASQVTVNYSCIEGLRGIPGGEGNIDDDPLFLNPGGGDYRLGGGSPCIDAGDNDAVPAGITTDLDGNDRFVDDPNTTDTGIGTPPIVDMGAYEFQPPCSWDCQDTPNGFVDIADMFKLFGHWFAPGPCDFDASGLGDINDLFAMFGNWGVCP